MLLAMTKWLPPRLGVVMGEAKASHYMLFPCHFVSLRASFLFVIASPSPSVILREWRRYPPSQGLDYNLARIVNQLM